MEIDFHCELSEHLAEDAVAILMEVGYERIRYVIGFAVAVNSDGDVLAISTDDIYSKVAEEWNLHPERAEY